MSPEDTSKRSDREKDNRELILPDKYSEASKRMGGDPTTDAPAPLMKEDKSKVVNQKESQQDYKKDDKENSKVTKED